MVFSLFFFVFFRLFTGENGSHVEKTQEIYGLVKGLKKPIDTAFLNPYFWWGYVSGEGGYIG